MIQWVDVGLSVNFNSGLNGMQNMVLLLGLTGAGGGRSVMYCNCQDCVVLYNVSALRKCSFGFFKLHVCLYGDPKDY